MVEKVRLDEQGMARRAAREFRDGMVVNLGVGIPVFCANYIEGKEIFLETENGALGFGPMPKSPEEADIYLVLAGDLPATRKPGMCFFSVDESFVLIRGGHVDIVVLGGMQVSAKGDLANWFLPGRGTGNVGGSMDLAYNAKKLIICMTHNTRQGAPKIVRQCSLPLTAPQCVDLIITDIAVIEVTADGLVLQEVAPGWTAAEVQAVTEPELIFSPRLKEIEL